MTLVANSFNRFILVAIVALSLPTLLSAQTGIKDSMKQVVLPLHKDSLKNETASKSFALPPQKDTLKHEALVKTFKDSTEKKKAIPFQPNPKKAGMYSALFPGAGQLYNRQYWKLPIIYAGLGVAAYFISSNLNDYNDYRKAYISSINNPNRTDKYANIYTSDQLNILQSQSEKFLDMTILFTGIGYIGQIMEAVAGAHLKNFDISEDISMRVRPMASPQGLGMGLVFCLK
jgi:hypothetical protein